jgi:hypothetical protein
MAVESTAASRAAATEPQTANVEPLVSATLVPSMGAVAEEAASTAHCTVSTGGSATFSSSDAAVVHAEGMSFWTFAKRNRKAQCGILVALLFLLGLSTALAVALSGPNSSNNDPLVQATIAEETAPSEESIQGAALPTPSPTPSPMPSSPTPQPTLRPAPLPTPSPTPQPTLRPAPLPTKELCDGCDSGDNDDDIDDGFDKL